ncbi:hypothetical protein ANCDUO_25569 [Ancylostoma duodenale]|uniref:Uncharacterized protein n=1 Tax=Ancylostoma duodenale TaxID=51022 RepID=A0A0C2FHM3_9BILA|nr:hypothetical protein ANCDUO_25569 [Ancylostoma duodenale]
MLKSVASLDYIKFSLAAIEKGLQLCKQKAKQKDTSEKAELMHGPFPGTISYMAQLLTYK